MGALTNHMVSWSPAHASSEELPSQAKAQAPVQWHARPVDSLHCVPTYVKHLERMPPSTLAGCGTDTNAHTPSYTQPQPRCSCLLIIKPQTAAGRHRHPMPHSRVAQGTATQRPARRPWRLVAVLSCAPIITLARVPPPVPGPAQELPPAPAWLGAPAGSGRGGRVSRYNHLRCPTNNVGGTGAVRIPLLLVSSNP